MSNQSNSNNVIFLKKTFPPLVSHQLRLYMFSSLYMYMYFHHALKVNNTPVADITQTEHVVNIM